MSRRSEAVKYLETIQYEAHKDLGTLWQLKRARLGNKVLNLIGPFVANFRQQRRLAESKNDELRKLLPKSTREFKTFFTETRFATIPDSAYEDPLAFRIYSVLIELIEDYVAQIDDTKQNKHEVIFGTLPSKELNAFIRRLRSDEYIIALNWGTTGFIYRSTQILAQCFGPSLTPEMLLSNSPSFIFNNLRDIGDEEIRELRNLIHAYVVLGDVYQVRPKFQLGKFQATADTMAITQQLFVLGHEYGHLLMGHLEQANVHSIPNESAERIIFNWNKEFEADLVGYKMAVVINSLRSDQIFLHHVFIELFFTMIDIVEKSILVFAYGEERAISLSNTHPPFLQRRNHIRELARGASIMSEKDAAEWDKITKLNQITEEWCNQLWIKLLPQYQNMHKKGYRPAPIWGFEQ